MEYVEYVEYVEYGVCEFYVCCACGYKAKDRLYKLKSECKPHMRTDYGEANLKSVESGAFQ